MFPKGNTLYSKSHTKKGGFYGGKNMLHSPALSSGSISGSSRVSGAQQPLKVGVILPMSGPFASSIGQQVYLGAKLYVAQHGDVVAGRKIELILRDDASVPESSKRIAQELLTNDHDEILAGFGLTPLAFAVAPIATAAKTPMIVMAADTVVIPEKSPYIMRTSFTLPQQTEPLSSFLIHCSMA